MGQCLALRPGKFRLEIELTAKVERGVHRFAQDL
jgi:hypothetical protein